MVGRIYHVGLTVSDLDKSIAFYRENCFRGRLRKPLER